MLPHALGLCALALLIPGIPLAVFGLSYEDNVLQFLQTDRNPPTTFAAIVVVLSADLILPIPSSAVSTYAGSQLGMWWGGSAVWLGMTLGACAGYALARAAGPALLRRLASRQDVAQLRKLHERFGGVLLLTTRPLPLLAEAAVVLAGSLQYSWWSFVLIVGSCNAVLALIYVGLGHWVGESPWFTLTLAASMLIPVSATELVRRWLRKRSLNSR